MLFLLVAVVGEDGLQVLVLAGIDPLVVPVHRLELFHEGSDRAVHVAGFVGNLVNRLVVTFVGHDSPSFGVEGGVSLPSGLAEPPSGL